MKGLRVAQAADLLISFEKVFVLQRLGNEIVAAGATAERERSQRRAARKQLAALPLEMKNNNNNRRVKKGKISERGLRAPGRVGSPRPAPSPGPRHLIPLLAAGPPRKAPGGGERIRAAGGSPRRRGGSLYPPFPSVLPCRSPPAHPALRAALLAGAGEGERGKGEGAGSRGGRGESCPAKFARCRYSRCGERGSPGRAGPAAAWSGAGGAGGAREGAVLPLSAGSHQ